jgi:lysophospholipase L1-like esterase
MVSVGIAQQPLRFEEEIEAIQEKYDTVFDASQETLVFTGSSSIRMWDEVQQKFPDHRVVNTGFGGSQASDLSYYIYDLILRFHPKKVFIYEGDNDVFAEKSPDQIKKDLQQIIDGIHRNSPDTQVVLIAAKPSIARWSLKGKYKRLNRKLKRLADDHPLVAYADVWNPMLDGSKVKQDIFIGDGLHMNAKGYQIWYTVLEPFVN